MLTAVTKPVALPAWVVSIVLLACGVVIAGGTIAFWAFLTINNSAQILPFTDDDRIQILNDMPGGAFINAGTYRRCVNGRVWFFTADGQQSTYGASCWK